MNIYLFWAFPIAFVAFAVFLVIGVIPSLILRALGFVKAGMSWLFSNSGIISRFIFRLLGIETKISGNLTAVKKMMENGERICLVANHTSLLDVPLVFGPLGLMCGFLAKKELSFVPVVNLACIGLHCVFINRNNLKESRKAISKAVKNISKGHAMLVFPEGSRSKTGKIERFRRGCFRLVTESKASVVPIAIKGLRVFLEDRKKVFCNGTCSVFVGDPIYFDFSKDRNSVIEQERIIEDTIRSAYRAL